jgi:hypothetical protein
MTETPRRLQLDEFIQELSGFASLAEASLSAIEADAEPAAQFAYFGAQMIAIRGTADQLHLPEVSRIAGLGEEISVKASAVTQRNRARRYVSSLWDALTTVRFMLEHPGQESGEEQRILENRLEAVLQQLGGARPTVNEDEIEALLRGQSH